MSSRKTLNMCRSEKCNVGQRSEDTPVSEKVNCRNMPPILRLDSTGEVTSQSFGGDNLCGRKCELSTKMNRSIQNLVNYVGSGISSHLTAETANPFDCVRKMLKLGEESFSGNTCNQSMADMVKTESQPQVWGSPLGAARNDNEAYPYFAKLSSWSNSVFSAFNKSNYNDKHWYPQTFSRSRYNNHSPYHRQAACWQDRNTHSSTEKSDDKLVDPHLKPYNARLLQKSKQCKKEGFYNQHVNHPLPDTKTTFPKPSSSVDKIKSDCLKDRVNKADNPTAENTADKQEKTGVKAKSERNVEISDSDHVNKSHGNNSGVETEKPQNGNIITDLNFSKVPVEAAEIVTDWFEYENKDLRTIPIDLKRVEQKTAVPDTSVGSETDSPSTHPPLHNWFSVDFDGDSVKCKSEELNKKASAHQLDKENNNDKHDKDEGNIDNKNGARQNNNSCDIKKINVKIQNINLGSKPEINNDSKESADKSFILYVRNFPSAKRSSKPSCKKRRRAKAQKETAVEEINANDPETRTPTKTDPKHKESPIAFILGIDSVSDSAGKSQPFLLCDINSDSEWSDSDLDCDDSPDDAVPEELSMFSLCDNFNPLNFKVTCSVQPSPTATSSLLDSINLSWQVNISAVDPDATQSKKSSDKKVHFPDEENLVEIHPVSEMIEWCDAYQECRKGPWEQFALDRERFKNRIKDSEAILDPILLHCHRHKIYSERFDEN